MEPQHALGAWNWFWLLRPEFDLVLAGTPWHTAVPIIPGLLVSIIEDIQQPGMLKATVSHPLVLGEWLMDARPPLRSIMVGRRAPYAVADPYSRCAEVAERMLRQRPFMSIKGGEYIYATD